MRIDIVFDTVCPWGYVGKRRLEEALALRPGRPVTRRWRPFLLNPQMPPDGMDRNTYLIRKFGSEARIKRVYGAISDAGQSVEISFAFDRIQRTPNSVNSHRLVRFADNEGRADDAVEALFHAYFLQGRNIGDGGALIEIGADLGLDTEALAAYLNSDQDVTFVYEENLRAHRQGINSVPSYLFDGEMAISGAHDPQVLARMLDVAWARTIEDTSRTSAA